MSTRSTLTKLLAGLVAGIGLLTAVSSAQALTVGTPKPTIGFEIYCVYLPTLNKDGTIRYILSCATVRIVKR